MAKSQCPLPNKNVVSTAFYGIIWNIKTNGNGGNGCNGSRFGFLCLNLFLLPLAA